MIINTTFSRITLHNNVVPLLHVDMETLGAEKWWGFCIYPKAFLNQAYSNRLVFFQSSFEGMEGTEAVQKPWMQQKEKLVSHTSAGVSKQILAAWLREEFWTGK